MKVFKIISEKRHCHKQYHKMTIYTYELRFQKLIKLSQHIYLFNIKSQLIRRVRNFHSSRFQINQIAINVLNMSVNLELRNHSHHSRLRLRLRRRRNVPDVLHLVTLLIDTTHESVSTREPLYRSSHIKRFILLNFQVNNMKSSQCQNIQRQILTVKYKVDLIKFQKYKKICNAKRSSNNYKLNL